MNTLEYMFESLNDQVAIAENKGNYLNSRFREFQIIHLFKLEDFYVELYYDINKSAYSRTKVTDDISVIKYYYPDDQQMVEIPFLRIKIPR